MEVNNMKENYVKPQIEVCQLNTENQLMVISGIPAKKEEPDRDLEILSLVVFTTDYYSIFYR